MNRKNILERRKAQRLNVPLQVKCRFFIKKKILIEEVFARDVSGGGIGLVLKRPLDIGAKLKTLIYFPNDRRPISFLTKVVWCKKVLRKGKICFDVGIKHIKITPKDKERFVFLFCETMINYFLLPGKVSFQNTD